MKRGEKIKVGLAVDIAGQRFGRLVAVRPTDQRNKQGGIIWECQCDCGNTFFTDAHSLKKGNTKTCGCSRSDPKPGRRRPNRGTRLYRVWSNMKTRCLIKNNGYAYSRYGGRGITICDEWLNFDGFAVWALSSGYSSDLTIDRIDNNKGYSPDNCRWVPMSVQNKNRSSTHFVTIDGVTKCVKDWMRELHKTYYEIIEMEGKHSGTYPLEVHD